MNFFIKFNFFSKNNDTALVSNKKSLTEQQVSYINKFSETSENLETKIPKRKIKQRKQERTKSIKKACKIKTYSQSHPNINKQYKIVRLTWDNNNNPVIDCYNDIADIEKYTDANQAGYIFKQHSGIVKIAQNSYLNTETGIIYDLSTFNTKKIKWKGLYLQQYANGKISIIEGERKITNNLQLKDKNSKIFFNNSSSESEDLSTDYAGSASENEVFFTANSEFESE